MVQLLKCMCETGLTKPFQKESGITYSFLFVTTLTCFQNQLLKLSQGKCDIVECSNIYLLLVWNFVITDTNHATSHHIT